MSLVTDVFKANIRSDPKPSSQDSKSDDDDEVVVNIPTKNRFSSLQPEADGNSEEKQSALSLNAFAAEFKAVSSKPAINHDKQQSLNPVTHLHAHKEILVPSTYHEHQMHCQKPLDQRGQHFQHSLFSQSHEPLDQRDYRQPNSLTQYHKSFDQRELSHNTKLPLHKKKIPNQLHWHNSLLRDSFTQIL